MVRFTLPALVAPASFTPTSAGRLVSPAVALPARELTIDDRLVHQLVQAARDASERAYAPFSQFRVGAAVTMANDPKGTVFTGANVENSSYGGTICAERSALTSAVSAGFHRIAYLAVSVRDALNGPVCSRSPCGLCRQFISQFCDPAAPDPSLIIIDDGAPDTLGQVFDIERLLPWGFRLQK